MTGESSVKSVEPQRYCFGSFTLDVTRGRLLCSGDEVPLRPKSFLTLQCLVENSGRLIDKNQLIAAVWRDTTVTDNSLVQCLRDVRQALGPSARRYIRTVPRRGYIFEEPVREDESSSIGSAGARSQLPAGQQGLKSLAVLPFTTLRCNGSEDFLGLGMADTLITKLGATGQIVVRPTSAIQRYTSNRQDSLAAGREQQVDAVLEGTVQRTDDKVRVTVRLFDVKGGATLWAETFDERLADVFALQDAVSARTAEALALRLTNKTREQLAKRYTDSPEAHQLYAKGVFLRNHMTLDGLQKSIDCFQQAIALDPRYALAYAGQASSYSPLAYLGYLSVDGIESTNRRLVLKALELDATLAEVHAAVAEFKLFIEWNWAEAERAFRTALDLNPRDQLTLLLYADLLLINRRPDEAVDVNRLGLETDPLSPRTCKALAWTYFFAGRYDDAIEQFNRTRDLFPEYPLIDLGQSYEQKGMYEEAIEAYLDTERRQGLSASHIVALRNANAMGGWRAYWRKRLELAEADAAERPVQSLDLARLHARLGNTAQTLAHLEAAVDRRELPVVLLSVDPAWTPYRSLPAFERLRRRIGLPA